MILVEAGTYIRGLNPMRKAQMSDVILTKYRGLIEDIEDHHFVCETVHGSMLKGYKGAKRRKVLPVTLWGGSWRRR